MAVHFFSSSPFEEARSRIEQHLFDSIMEIENNSELALASVNRFAQAIEKITDTLEEIHQTPKPDDIAGEKSISTGDGRYRLFYKVAVRKNDEFESRFSTSTTTGSQTLTAFRPTKCLPSTTTRIEYRSLRYSNAARHARSLSRNITSLAM